MGKRWNFARYKLSVFLFVLGMSLFVLKQNIRAEEVFSDYKTDTITFTKEQLNHPGYQKLTDNFVPATPDEISAEQFSTSSTLSKKNVVIQELANSPVKASFTITGQTLKVSVYNASVASGRRIAWVRSGLTQDGWTQLDQNTSLKLDSNQKCEFSIDFSSYQAGNFKVVFYMQKEGESSFESFMKYGFTVVDSDLTFDSFCGEHEFDYYMDLLKELDPEDYNQIPAQYYTTDSADYYYVGDQMDDIVAKAEEITENLTTDEQKVKAIHDWICYNFAYDCEYLKRSGSANPKSYKLTSAPYYTFQSETAVCAGYSRLNQLMLTSLGIPCLDVMGYGDSQLVDATSFSPSLNHEWNLIYLSGEWYVFDLTWDSPNKYYADSSKDVLKQNAGYTYYGITPYAFGCDHYSMQQPSDGYVKEISFYRAPTKTSFKVGDTFSTYFVLSVKLSTGSTKQIMYSKTSISGYDLSKVGKQTVTVSYAGKELTYDINVTCETHLTTAERITEEPSCSKKGKKQIYCTVCEEIVGEEEIPATSEHHYGEWIVVREATCVEEGFRYRDCTGTGCTNYEYEYTKVVPHNMGEWVEVVSPSCFENGQEQSICQNDGCDHSETRPILATDNHVYSDWNLKQSPDCIHKGIEERRCTTKGCSSYEQREVDATGVHSYGTWQIDTKPTCVSTGKKHRVCTIDGCDAIDEQSMEQITTHSLGVWQEYLAPTSTKEGEERRYCQIDGCDYYETREIEKLHEHIYGEWSIVLEPTCVCEGVKRRVCTVVGCKEYEVKNLAATSEHVYGAWIVLQEATCVRKGKKYHVCQNENCGLIQYADLELSSSHQLGEWQEYEASTIEKQGEQRCYCQVVGCDYYKTRSIPKLEPVDTKQEEANSGDTGNKQEESNPGDTGNKQEEANPGDTGNKQEEANPGDTGNKQEESNPGDTGNKQEGTNSSDTGYKQEEANPGDTGNKQEESNPGDTGNKQEGTNSSDTGYKQEETNKDVSNLEVTIESVSGKISISSSSQVSVSAISDSKATSVTISSSIRVNGKTYSITSIEKKVFAGKKKLKTVVIGKNVRFLGSRFCSGCKSLKTITIKTTKLTDKTVAKDAFKGITSKTTIKVPKKKLSAYKKLFKKKGLSSKVKVKAY